MGTEVGGKMVAAAKGEEKEVERKEVERKEVKTVGGAALVD